MRVLIVKLSSMGDIIHALPALTDVSRVFPDVRFDWVAEEAFVEVPQWHPHVDEVIPIAIRRWRRHFWRLSYWKEMKTFLTQLRAKKYDLVIDAQASWKSAIVTRLAKGVRCGMDAKSVREPFAHIFYQNTFYVSRKQHALLRLRELFAKVFNYPLPHSQPDYAIDTANLLKPVVALPHSYIVGVHNASWSTKLWPEEYWRELIPFITATGRSVVLPWGNAAEYERAKRIAANLVNVVVLPKLSLSEMAFILAHAQGAVCSDTGLAHLTAALNIPAVTLYGPTNPALIGTMGRSQLHLCADFPCAPCRQMHCNYKKDSAVKPACYTRISPQKVWHSLQGLLNNGK